MVLERALKGLASGFIHQSGKALMAFDYLVDNALRSVWCAPTQEKQDIFQLARLTPDGGELNSYQVMWNQVTLPTQGDAYHVYQVGQVNPLMLGLLPNNGSWATLASAMNAKNLIVDLYTIEGYQFPRFQSYYMVTAQKLLIVAVKIQPLIPVSLDTDALFIRVYSNGFFQSSRARLGSQVNYVQTGGVVPAVNADILAIQNTITALSALPGACYAFVNGYKVNMINVMTVAIGDIVEYVYDSSIYKVVDFPFENLPTFNSTLDNKYKYLLHYAGTSDNVIDYQGDVDVWLYYAGANGVTQGVYYHHNNLDSLRNVTHRDYSIPTAYVAGFVADQEGWTEASNVTIRLHIRQGGFARPLVYENNRILDLYTLPDQNILSAMVGVDSTLVNWQAATLEASDYVQIMGEQNSTNINRAMVESAYGYNAVANLVGATPLVPTLESGQLIVMLPYNLQSNSTAWEYDNTGTLLGFYAHTSGGAYTCQNNTCALVEVLSGTASNQLDDTYGQQTQTLDPTADYRMYVCMIDQGTGNPTYLWQDVTASSNYSIVNNVLTWALDMTQWYTCVRSNKVMLAYQLFIQPVEGALTFQLQQEAIRDFVLQLFAMQIPMGQLDIFLNGKTMVPNLDYIMDFPEVSINNVTALEFPQNRQQIITVRWQGFCNTDLTLPTADVQTGFVQYGLLANINQYTILDDEVLRISVGGQVYQQSALSFPETSADVTAPVETNGLPYMIQKVTVPMRGITNENTYAYKALSETVDEAVANYMTQYFPLPQASGPDVITALYPVFSPFCCKIIYDLVNGTIDTTPLQSFYNDAYVRTVCAPYEYLLAYDPTQPATQPDLRFVTIQPHNLNVTIGLNLYCYNFLKSVIRIYLNGLVSLTNFVSVAALGTAQGTGGTSGST
jgi:hypothetical protein